MRRTIIIGYGNTDRQDDGAAWYVLATLRHLLGKPESKTSGEAFEALGDNPHFIFTLQLTPEMAETLVNYGRVCFVDAHTGSVPEEIHLRPVKVEYQRSTLTHHMTPDTLLALCLGLYNQTPEAILVSLRGYQFGFERSLSPQTQVLIEPAAQQILAWLSLN